MTCLLLSHSCQPLSPLPVDACKSAERHEAQFGMSHMKVVRTYVHMEVRKWTVGIRLPVGVSATTPYTAISACDDIFGTVTLYRTHSIPRQELRSGGRWRKSVEACFLAATRMRISKHGTYIYNIEKLLKPCKTIIHRPQLRSDNSTGAYCPEDLP